ncbi:MAG: hypothetical protein AB1426_12000 [Bacillota bacterium]
MKSRKKQVQRGSHKDGTREIFGYWGGDTFETSDGGSQSAVKIRAANPKDWGDRAP